MRGGIHENLRIQSVVKRCHNKGLMMYGSTPRASTLYPNTGSKGAGNCPLPFLCRPSDVSAFCSSVRYGKNSKQWPPIRRMKFPVSALMFAMAPADICPAL